MVLDARLLGTALCAAALALLPGAGGKAHADGGWWGDLDKGMNVRLADVLESPERFRGRALTFACVFHQTEREFNPLRTRFNAERYDNVSVWPDGTAIWAKNEFVRDFPFLYVARTHPSHDMLVRQEMYTRLELTARIEAVIDGNPFLEVTGVKVTGHKLGSKVMDLMLRGEVHGQSAGVESQTLAAQNFQAALTALPDLAPIYAQRIRERLAQALTNLGRSEEAKRLLGPAAPGPAEVVAPPPVAGPAFPPPAPTGPIVDAPQVPRGGSLPGSDAPLMPPPPVSPPPAGSATPGPEVGSVPLEGSPDGDAPPAAPRLRGPQPRVPAPVEARPPPSMPSGPIRPTLPGVPADNMPVLPTNAPGQTRSADPDGLPPVPPSAQRPSIVDPPLPAPAPGQGAPPRRPRLSGVK